MEAGPVGEAVRLLGGADATNGQIIATSEAYESKANALKGIESVKRNAPNAEVDDLTDR